MDGPNELEATAQPATQPIFPPPVPPSIQDGETGDWEQENLLPKWRGWLHLFLLVGYVLGIGLIGSVIHSNKKESKIAAAESILPGTASGLLSAALMEMITFGIVFGIAIYTSKATARQLLLVW